MAVSTPDLRALLSRALTPDGAADATEERMLDAARGVVAAEGGRGATIDEVARRAGVGRVTVFRRLGSKDELLARMFAREVRRFLLAIDRAPDSVDDPAERVAEAFVACVRAAHEHPLVARLVGHEPGAALEQLSSGDPSPLDLGRAYV